MRTFAAACTVQPAGYQSDRPAARGRVSMWSIIEHRGRRSGAVYRTPVSMFPTPDGVAILLAYGTTATG